MTHDTKVLVVTTTFPRNDKDDQPRFVLDLCKTLADKYEHLVLAPSGPGCDSTGEVEGIRVRRFRYFFRSTESVAYGSGILANLKARPARWLLVPFFMLGLVLAIRKELREFQPDIVHTHWWMPAGLAARIAIATTKGDFKLLITCHGTDYYVLGERFARLRRWLFERSDAIAMVSPAMREHAIARTLPENKMHIAPMGVDLRNQFVPGANSDRRGVLYVGRLVEKKGVDDLLNAWAVTTEQVRDQGLTIIGAGSQKQALQELSKVLGVSESVTFVGPVSHQHLPAYYQRAALLVFPSTSQEGLGLVAVEAMGCCCPVLASNIDSLADLIEDGQSGFIYPLGDTAALAQKLEELIVAPELCNRIAAWGRQAVRERFEWSVVSSKYQSLYDELHAASDATGSCQ